MKKISLIIFTVILNTALFSCTPDSLASEEETILAQEATGGEDGDIDSEDDDEEMGRSNP